MDDGREGTLIDWTPEDNNPSRVDTAMNTFLALMSEERDTITSNIGREGGEQPTDFHSV